MSIECPKCGVRLVRPGALFCDQCGSPVPGSLSKLVSESEELRTHLKDRAHLQARLNALESTLRARSQELEPLRARALRLEAENKELKDLYAKTESERVERQDLLARVKELEPLQGEIVALQGENRELKAKAEAGTAENESLRTQVKELESIRAESVSLEAENKELKDRTVAQTVEHERLSARAKELEPLQAKIVALEAVNRQLNDDSSARNREYEYLRTRLTKLEPLQEKVATLETEKKQLKAALDSADYNLRAKARELEPLQGRAATLEAENNELKAKTSKQSVEYEAVRARLKELQPLQSRVSSAEAESRELKALKDKGDAEREDLRAKVKKLEPLQAKSVALEAENRELKAKTAAENAEIKSLRSKAKELESLQAKFSGLEAENRKLKDKAAAVSAEYGGLRARVRELEPLQGKVKELESLQGKAATLRAETPQVPRARPFSRLASRIRWHRERPESSAPAVTEAGNSGRYRRVDVGNIEKGFIRDTPTTPKPGIALTQETTLLSPEAEKKVSKPNPAPEDLLAKIQELEKEKQSLRVDVWKTWKRPSSLAVYAMAGVGGLALILSVVYASTVLAFIGLGLAFWGALLVFIRPKKYVRSELMDSTALSSLRTIDRLMTSLGYTEKGVYLPAHNPEKAVVFVPAKPLSRIPRADEVEHSTFVKDPTGMTMVPTGLALANLFERELGVQFSETSLEALSERLPKLLIEDLELVQAVEMNIKGNNVTFKFVESIYSDFCSQLRTSTKVCSSVGCPICSAMACVIAQAAGKPVVFDEDSYSADGKTVETSYRILDW